MSWRNLCFVLVIAYQTCWSEAFCGRCGLSVGDASSSLRKLARDAVNERIDLINDRTNNEDGEKISRRALFHQSVVALSSGASLLRSPSVSRAANRPATRIGKTPRNPVAILGAGGKTGMMVAQALAREGMYCVTMSRSGRDPFQIVKLKPEMQQYITHYEPGVNVLDKSGMEEALKEVHASAIVYCASASRKGGNAFQVDDEGVGNAALVSKDLNARFILVSALAVDRPNSKSYQITNTLGGKYQGIMGAKLQGEEKVRSTLSKSKDYVIVRPGVLLNGVSRNGAIDLEVNQGDTIGGGLSRDELAGVVVGALTSGKQGVTVEVYRRSTATPLQPNYSIPSGYEASATTFEGLFDNVESDSKVQSS